MKSDDKDSDVDRERSRVDLISSTLERHISTLDALGRKRNVAEIKLLVGIFGFYSPAPVALSDSAY